MHSYFAYGLGIHSELELPELMRRSADPDITIRMAHLDFSSSEARMESGAFCTDANQARARYSGIGAFLIRGGSEVWIDSAPNVNVQELRLMLLGPVFALLLHQRGQLVLHASSVARDDRAVAFLAEAGGGKSTTAAAMLARGCHLIADDILALQPNPASLPILFPAFPFLKVWPEAAAELGQDIRAAPRVNAQLEKRVWKIADALTSPAALHRIYVLDRGEPPRIERLTPQESFITLVRHTFVAQLLDATHATTHHFQQCSILANQVPCRRLLVPSSLHALAAVAELVEADFSGKGGLA